MRCLVRQKTGCSEGACLEYDAFTLRFWLFGLALAYKAIGVVCALTLILFWPCIQRRKVARLEALLAARQRSRTHTASTHSAQQPISDQQSPPQPPPDGHSGTGLAALPQLPEREWELAADFSRQQAASDKSQQQASATAAAGDPSDPNFSGNLIELAAFKPPLSLAPGHMRSASDNTALMSEITSASSPTPTLLASASGAEFGSSSQSKLFPPSSAATSTTSKTQSGSQAGLVPFTADDSGVSSKQPSSLNSSHSNTPFAAHDAIPKKAISRNSSYGGGVTGFWHSLGKRLRSQRSSHSPDASSSSRSHQLKRMHDVSERGDARGPDSPSPNAVARLGLTIKDPSPSVHQPANGAVSPTTGETSAALA